MRPRWRSIPTMSRPMTISALPCARRITSRRPSAASPKAPAGARPETGFACPLLAQIADELRAAYPAIFLDHPLLYAWSFKYDNRLKGTKIHADFAAVNVNFWITPDQANLDAEGGGLLVWDVAAPLDWDFERYNRDEGAIREFLRQRQAKSLRIPYQANR